MEQRPGVSEAVEEPFAQVIGAVEIDEGIEKKTAIGPEGDSGQGGDQVSGAVGGRGEG